MKRLFISLFALLTFSTFVVAQDISPKRLTLLPHNLLAREKPLVSQKSGKNCAVILVDVVGVKNIEFLEAEGKPSYSLNEYTIYVPEGTKSLTYKRGKETGTIIFGDYGPDEVEGKCTYRLMMDTKDKMRSALFYVKPQNATAIVGGKKVNFDSNGAGSVDLPIGSYPYSISAEGYGTETGTLNLTDNEIIVVKDITLDEIKYGLHISCNRGEASLFVDNAPYGKISDIGGYVQLPAGKHKVRVTLEGYNDFTGDITVNDNSYSSVNVNLKEKKAKVIRHKDERTKSSVNIRPHVDILFSDHTLIDDFGTNLIKFSVEYHQYIGLLAFKEGINFGGGLCSTDFCKKIDDYTDIIKDGEGNKCTMNLDIPLQIGFALPLSKYNTSNVDFLLGGYASGYYIGHSSKSTTTGVPVSTYSLDYGLRANVTFYLNRFALSIEGGQSLSKLKLGTFIGLHLGWRMYKHKKK